MNWKYRQKYNKLIKSSKINNFFVKKWNKWPGPKYKSECKGNVYVNVNEHNALKGFTTSTVTENSVFVSQIKLKQAGKIRYSI